MTGETSTVLDRNQLHTGDRCQGHFNAEHPGASATCRYDDESLFVSCDPSARLCEILSVLCGKFYRTWSYRLAFTVCFRGAETTTGVHCARSQTILHATRRHYHHGGDYAGADVKEFVCGGFDHQCHRAFGYLCGDLRRAAGAEKVSRRPKSFVPTSRWSHHRHRSISPFRMVIIE